MKGKGQGNVGLVLVGAVMSLVAADCLWGSAAVYFTGGIEMFVLGALVGVFWGDA